MKVTYKMMNKELRLYGKLMQIFLSAPPTLEKMRKSHERTKKSVENQRRETNYTGLPPAYSLIGSVDLFVDETKEYFANLKKAGVPTKGRLSGLPLLWKSPPLVFVLFKSMILCHNRPSSLTD